MRTAIVGVDASLCLLIGIGLVFAPHIAADLLFKGVSDGIHWHLLRSVGGQLVAAAFMLFCIHKGASEVQSSCYLVRIIGMSLILLMLNHAVSMSPNLISFKLITTLKYWCYMTIAAYGSMQTISGWAIGNTLIKSNKMGNFLYQMDSIASIVIGGAFFAFPKWLLYKQVNVELNETHEFCGRLLGALFMSSYIVSSHALHWYSNTHRLFAVDARSIVCIVILSAQLWSQYAYSKYWSSGHWIGILLYSAWTTISLLFRYTLGRVKVPTETKKCQ